MQKEIKNRGKLLDQFGNLRECGYAKSLILDYDRNDIKANKLRIKEWDYYLIYNEKYALAFTIADNSYMGLISASWIDFTQPMEITKSIMTILPKGKTGLPESSAIGDCFLKNNKVSFEFLNNGQRRLIKVTYKKFNKNEDLSAEIELVDEPQDSMVIATPFKKDKHFYYNQKIVGMKASGWAKLGDKEIKFNDNALGILDWGRGVWTYKNTWYWGAGCGMVKGHLVGFNIGYGFGDTSSASENMIFYDGVAHKIQDVQFNIPKDKNGNELYTEPWTFTSSDGRFEMDFVPIIDRKSYTSAVVISSDQHQVFGRFTGTILLDNGKKIQLNDFIGFAEKVVNKW